MSNRPKLGLGIALLALVIAMPLSAASVPVAETSAPAALLESFDAMVADSEMVTLEESCYLFDCDEHDRQWARDEIRRECGWAGGFMEFTCGRGGITVHKFECWDEFIK